MHLGIILAGVNIRKHLKQLKFALPTVPKEHLPHGVVYRSGLGVFLGVQFTVPSF